MIKEINKPNINFKFAIFSDDKFYHNQENNEFLIKNFYDEIYFNINGEIHKIGKPAYIKYNINNSITHREFLENNKMHRLDGPAYDDIYNYEYFICGICYFPPEFAKKTNHLICKYCNNFCKQECFF